LADGKGGGHDLEIAVLTRRQKQGLSVWIVIASVGMGDLEGIVLIKKRRGGR